MQPEPVLKFAIAPQLNSLAEARLLVTQVLEKSDLNFKQLSLIEVAIDEVLTNIIQHGFSSTPKQGEPRGIRAETKSEVMDLETGTALTTNPIEIQSLVLSKRPLVLLSVFIQSNSIIFDVLDNGQPYNPLQPIDDSAGAETEFAELVQSNVESGRGSGLGQAMYQKVMDKVEYSTALPPMTNLLRLTVTKQQD